MKFSKFFRVAHLFLWGIIFQANAWGACSGDTAINTALVVSQINNAWLCSYSITNSGSISIASANGFALSNLGTINNLTNNGNISSAGSGSTYGIRNSGGTIDSLVNSGTISASNVGISNNTSISVISNSGTISGANKGIGNTSGTISNIINSGIISSDVGSAIYIQSATNSASIGSITNTGSMTGAIASINNINATLGTLNNLQGAGNSNNALTYTGILPTNYNIIINSPTSYGRLNVSSGTGATIFGIYAGGVSGVPASTIAKGTYASVLSGVFASNLTGPTYGRYGSLAWSLIEVDSVSGLWDLFVGPSSADTQQSLVNTASALQGTFALQNSVLANSFSYDCTEFGAHNVCISAGGRNTAVSAANGLNNTSALLIAAYRPHPSFRIGAYADQNLSVRNSGSTVALGNNTPLIGLFGAWNERPDGLASEVKVSAAYGQKNTTVTRAVVGTSEAGSGSSQLNSQGAQVVAKYGFGIVDNLIVSPYVGIRYTQNNMNGYSEQATSLVTAPLTYSALNTNATTALAGVGASFRVAPPVTTFASAGVETNTNTNNGSYSGTNSNIPGLTAVNFNANPVKTRPTATLGAYYDIEKNQRLGVTGIYRQESYQAVSTTTVMATYTVGL